MPSRENAYFEDLLKFVVVPNEPRHAEEARAPRVNAEYVLLVVEFDDQGLPYRPNCMDTLERVLAGFEGRHPIVLVFTHGWKHNAAPGDTNLDAFQGLLADTAARAARENDSRPVLGVYLSWRGLSRSGNWLWEQSSFWDRQEAARRVALGSPREVLGRLKTFRNGPPGKVGPPAATLLVVGHSFGGLVVFSAIAQSLIEAAAAPGEIAPSFGDLVLLVNPAFSAVSYLPIHEILARRTFAPNQLPVFVSVTALNDWATGLAFPAGNLFRRLTEATRNPHERDALVRTMGHIEWMRTHELTIAPPASGRADAPGSAEAGVVASGPKMKSLSGPARTETFGEVMVKSLPGRLASPFWVASATSPIIDGHNGIFQSPFEDFIRALLSAHVRRDPGQSLEATTEAAATESNSSVIGGRGNAE